jgi:hypothetical protein
VIYNMDFEIAEDADCALHEHDDGSVDIRIHLVPGSSKRVFVLGSRLRGSSFVVGDLSQMTCRVDVSRLEGQCRT